MTRLRKCTMRLLLSAIPVLAMATTAYAVPDFINGYGWRSTEAITSSATGASPASLALGTCHNGAGACTHANADVTFTTTGLGFDVEPGPPTVAQWLATSTFPLHSLVNGLGAGAMDPTIWEFVGNAAFTSPDTFTIRHDDGVTLIINGQLVMDHPGPTSPDVHSGTYTGAAGASLPFQLVYAECCQGPAVLSTSLFVQTPEPATLLLLGLGLGVAGLGYRRRRKLS